MGLVKKPARAGHPDLALLHQELSQLIGRLVEFDRGDRADLGDWLPSVDVFEYRGTLTVVIEVPGLSPAAGGISRGDPHRHREHRPRAQLRDE